MASIDRTERTALEIARVLQKVTEHELRCTAILQQGAISALAQILKEGCAEQNVARSLAEARLQAQIARAEFRRRGLPPLFADDQTGFD